MNDIIEISDILNDTEKGKAFLESAKKKIEKKYGLKLSRMNDELIIHSEVEQ